MKEEIKKYIDCYIPTETCNLRCEYCYITQQRKFNNKLIEFKYDIDYMIKAFSKERLGGTCLINLCAGGETLLAGNMIDFIKGLLEEGHYVMIVTNGTLNKRFEELAKLSKELLSKLFFKFSFHYKELERLKKMDDFFSNVKLMGQQGASYTVEITPNDELIEDIEDIKKICKEQLGNLPHITIARSDTDPKISVRSKYTLEEYKKIWSTFESELLNFKSEIFYKPRKEFCYAGDWTLHINLTTGDVKQCYRGAIIDNIYKDITKPIKKLAIGNYCREPHCYNGHSFLVLGAIPELDTPTYADLRNRISNSGNEWLKPEMKEFMQTKLKETNEEYDEKKKKKVNRKNKIIVVEENIKQVVNRNKRLFKIKEAVKQKMNKGKK